MIQMHKLEYKKEVNQIDNAIIKKLSDENNKNQLELSNLDSERVNYNIYIQRISCLQRIEVDIILKI